jgi:2-oxoglutarate ferredoxin oxidoreductase subunit beta
VGVDALVRHDARRDDPSLAFALSRLSSVDGGATPIGIFRQVARPGAFRALSGELADARADFDDAALTALLHQADTWSVA